MKCLKHDVNLTLVYIIGIVVLLFVGSTIFYHLSLKSVVLEQEEQAQLMRNLESEKRLLELQLQELTKLKNNEETDKYELSKNYARLQAEIEVLEEQRSELLAQRLTGLSVFQNSCSASGSADCPD